MARDSRAWVATVAPGLVPDTSPLLINATGLLAEATARASRCSSVG